MRAGQKQRREGRREIKSEETGKGVRVKTEGSLINQSVRLAEFVYYLAQDGHSLRKGHVA